MPGAIPPGNVIKRQPTLVSGSFNQCVPPSYMLPSEMGAGQQASGEDAEISALQSKCDEAILDSRQYDDYGNYTGGRNQDELYALTQDPSHGGLSNDKAVAEREVGLGIESQGKVGKLIRDPSGSADFIEAASGQKWDVKAFRSDFKPKSYELTEAIGNIQRSISKGEYVMLDTRNLSMEDLTELSEEVTRQGLTDKVIIWP